MIDSTPRFLNGAFPFTGTGYDKPGDARCLCRWSTSIPRRSKRAQLIYLRRRLIASAELAYITLMQDGKARPHLPARRQ